jgi:hypothetical protein
MKEPSFFACVGESAGHAGPGDAKRIRRWDDYCRLFEGAGSQRVVVEASPLYLYEAEAIRRIAETVPACKLIALLRDPASRAFSQFTQHRMDGREPCRKFADALAAEGERMRLGFYDHQLERVFEHISREQVRVYLFDDMVEDPEGTLNDVARFLGLGAGLRERQDRRSQNKAQRPRSRRMHALFNRPNVVKDSIRPLVPPWMRNRVQDLVARVNLREMGTPSETLSRLRREYDESVMRTGDLIGRDLSNWREESPGEE